MTNFIIKDWAGNVMQPSQMIIHYKATMKAPDTFASFEDAEDFLCEVLNEKYEEDRQEYLIEEYGNE